MKVTLRLENQSEPMIFDVKNAYTKGPLYCMRMLDGETMKFPLCSIFSIKEEGGFTSQVSNNQQKEPT